MRLHIFLFTSFLVSKTFCQVIEVNANLYSGFFSFKGNRTVSTNAIIFMPYSQPNEYVENPYGKSSDFSYSIELQIQKIIKKNIIIGIGLSYESLSSSSNIDRASTYGFMNYHFLANGKVVLKNKFLTLNPYFGKRYKIKKLSLDINAGIDIGFCLESKENGFAITENGSVMTSSNLLTKPNFDIRPRLQSILRIKKIGLILGYSYGLTNYNQLFNVSSNYLRLGLNYRLK